MDALGALALATEDPDPKLLERKPGGRTEPLITGTMIKHVVVQGSYQVALTLGLLYGAPNIPAYAYPVHNVNTVEIAALCGPRVEAAQPCPLYVEVSSVTHTTSHPRSALPRMPFSVTFVLGGKRGEAQE